MENLSENAENLRKVLTHYPNGTVAKQLQIDTGQRHSKVYEALEELASKGFINHKGKVWTIKEKPSKNEEKPSVSKPLSKAERKLVETRAEFYTNAEWYGQQFPSLKPLKDYADISKAIRKELGLEP